MKSISANAPIVGLIAAIFHTTAVVAPTQLVVSAFVPNTPIYTTKKSPSLSKKQHQVLVLQSTTNNEETANEISKAPTLNGKAVLPLKAMKVGLKGHKVAAVYALLNKNYKRGSGEGWEHVENVGITKDLANVLNNSDETTKQYNTAYVRALSFTYPQKSTMEDFAEGWRMKVQEAQQRMKMMSNDDDLVGGGTIATIQQRGTQQQQMNVITVGDEYEFDEDDEDMDEDELDDYLQMMAESRAAVSSSSSPLFVDATSSSSIDSATAAASDDGSNIISPFESETSSSTPASKNNIEQEGPLELNKENVDKVLDEVRPYLISDGGNVSVHNVDTSTGNVYLVLEGACGSCASSTVTMQMGIERVLKEKFEEKLGEVIQVDPNDGNGGDGGKPTELTMEAVQSEVKRISQAITAMGGVVRVVSVDKIGVVEIEFRGPNKVKKGLELALLDVEYVKHVKFVS